MNSNQAQVKISLSEQLNEFLKYKAQRFGSDGLEKISEKAMKEIDKSVAVDDIDDFFQKL